MRFTDTCITLIALGAVAVAGHLVHHEHGHQHDHEAVSYAEVTNHEVQSQDSPKHHHVGHEHDHHEHHVEHHLGHPEHQVEHHGNNGHDDHYDQHDEHHGHVKYEFKYGVNDPKTGDVKEQWEARDGDSVKGGYTLKEADGTTRLVKYTSNKKMGFEATVHKIGHAHHEQGHQEHYGHH